MIIHQIAVIGVRNSIGCQIVLIQLDLNHVIVLTRILGMQHGWRMQVANHHGYYRDQM